MPPVLRGIGKIIRIQLFSFFLNLYMDKGFENPEERDWLFCNEIFYYYIIYLYIYRYIDSI